MSQVVSENEEYLKKAMIEGISGPAMGQIFDKLASIPPTTQTKAVVEAIADMKTSVQKVQVSEKYLSSFVEKYSDRIKRAIYDGLSPKEISESLLKQANFATDKKSLLFVVKLVSRMKEHEEALIRKQQMEESKTNNVSPQMQENKIPYQKVYENQ